MLTLLTIAGTDPTGGAGITADIQVFRDFDCHGLAVPTAVFDQDSMHVHARLPLSATAVAGTVARILEGGRPAAVKVGVLYDAAVADAVADVLLGYTGPIVLDPVLASGLGDSLQARGLLDALRRWFRVATVVTPNVPEAAALLGREIASDPAAGAAALSQRGPIVLLKGGHLPDAPGDWLADDTGVHFMPRGQWFAEDVHGTGCHLSSALAALLGLGFGFREAVEGARRYLAACVGSASRFAGDVGGRPLILHGDATRAAAREVMASIDAD